MSPLITKLKSQAGFAWVSLLLIFIVVDLGVMRLADQAWFELKMTKSFTTYMLCQQQPLQMTCMKNLDLVHKVR